MIVEELIPPPDPLKTLRAIRHLGHPLLLESALQREPMGRYSFLSADPFQMIEVPHVRTGSGVLAEVDEVLKRFAVDAIPGLPPFQGGVAGLLGYSAGRIWEKIPESHFNEFPIPDVSLGVYDWVIAWDHVTNRAWLISQGFPELDENRRRERASRRISQVRNCLNSDPLRGDWKSCDKSLPLELLAPSFPLATHAGAYSNFSRDGYLAAVRRAIGYLYAGDIFQVNLSQRLLYPLIEDPLEIYGRLRARNPAPFAGYFEHPEWVISSASPERFVQVCQREVETRPIKGTRRRQSHPEADLFTRDELRESEKDHAENVMIVDLLRNDLSKVCLPGSIRVAELCSVETYETVQHLVSQVRATLRPGATLCDLMGAVFPGGSITGAPKVRAMEIIAELEPTARGAYCGSLCYFGFGGQLDSSILIRTFIMSRGWIQFPVGGGIVVQSDPETEYLETLTKAAGMFRALRKDF